MTFDLSIIIVNYNTREPLRRCLASIQEQRGDLDVEVIVVDNGSKDGSPRTNLTMEQALDPDFIQQALVPLASETHGGEDLGIYAIGPWAHPFQGTVEENYTFHVMNHASQIGARAAAAAAGTQ